MTERYNLNSSVATEEFTRINTGLRFQQVYLLNLPELEMR